MRIFEPLYEKVLSWARHPHAVRYLAGLSFAESSFFPVPPDVMLAPMCVAKPRKAWTYAMVTTVASLAGGIAGYFIGLFLFDAIEPWLQTTHYWEPYLHGREWFDRYGVWAVFVAGFSPIPYKVFTISAGVAVLNLPGFIVASFIGRGARFFLVAGLIVAGGPGIEKALQRYVERIGWAVVVVASLGIAWFTLRT